MIDPEKDAVLRRSSPAWMSGDLVTPRIRKLIDSAIAAERSACAEVAVDQARKFSRSADMFEPGDDYDGPNRHSNRAVAALFDACADACYRVEGAIRSRK